MPALFLGQLTKGESYGRNDGSRWQCWIPHRCQHLFAGTRGEQDGQAHPEHPRALQGHSSDAEMNIKDCWLTPNRWSRPQRDLPTIKGIVVHWVANPNTTAEANRNFFESRKTGNKGFGSAHEIIGNQGEIIRCIPENEMAYHVGSKSYQKEGIKRLSSYPNNCTYGIECCHTDRAGRMKRATVLTLIERLAVLCTRWQLNPLTDLYLHQEIVGWKDCHRWWVNNPDDWQAIKWLVKAKMNMGETSMDFE